MRQRCGKCGFDELYACPLGIDQGFCWFVDHKFTHPSTRIKNVHPRDIPSAMEERAKSWSAS